MLTNFDYLVYEIKLQLDYLEAQLRGYEGDRERFSEWLVDETRGKVLALKKILERADTIVNQNTINSLVDDILANPSLTTAAQIEEAAASEQGLEAYTPNYSPQQLVEAPSVGLVARVERYPAGWVAWLSVRIPGRTCSSRGDCFWLPVGELFGDFRPLSARPRVRTERAPSALYSLGFTRSRAELKSLFGVLPPANPSLYQSIIEMPDESKWQAVLSESRRWVNWVCVMEGISLTKIEEKNQ